jgi:HAD superfamily 5'-nucleotidase-like hydrolase
MTDTSESPPELSAWRRIYANRTLNLRSIGAIGYDMDYTLVHYKVDTWERHAYERIKDLLGEEGWPVDDLQFDPDLAIRGLVIDTELGNMVKANRFGYVMRAAHGTRMLEFDEQREAYRHTPVDLSESRFFFLNTLFSLSGSCLFAQLVDLYDEHRFPDVHGYHDLFDRIGVHFDQAHVEGTMKADIVADPDRFIELDPDAALALQDQIRAGKRLMLISNAEWPYVREVMSHSYDRFLTEGTSWSDLFELVIVGARKPDFFSHDMPLFAVVDEKRGLLEPVPASIPGPGLYLGGDASRIEEYLGMSGSEILFVGDHIFADVRMSKQYLRWRTALILRELEAELDALDRFRDTENQLTALMEEKERLEIEQSKLRIELQRVQMDYGPQPTVSEAELEAQLASVWALIEELDARVAPLARDAGEIASPRWGPLLRAGNDKSHLARQVEQSADIYTSRISNFLHATPFAYLRSTRGTMPHDP